LAWWGGPPPGVPHQKVANGRFNGQSR
jgi:hypothetical protein